MVYESGEYSWSKAVNTYVGGDAYNYIINANYATGYFVLSGILVLGAIGCGIMWNFYELRNPPVVQATVDDDEITAE